MLIEIELPVVAGLIYMGNENDVQALRRMSGLVTPMVLRVAVTLGLPDRLRDGGAVGEDTAGDATAVAALAAELGVDAQALDLLLAHLTALGVTERTAAGYRITDFGALLCADAGNGLHGFLHQDSPAGRADLAFADLLHSVRTGEAAYEVRYGQGFWADLAERPDLRGAFDRQMNHRMAAWIPRLVAATDWSRFGTLVDVGGGNGRTLAAILQANPGMRGHLVDLAETVEGAAEMFRERGLEAEVTGGSFFDPLPAGDTYLLVDVLHNWDDEKAHEILARCAQGTRVLVVESLGESTEFDLVMLVHFGGRDRGLHDLEQMAARHGLALESVTQVNGRSLLEFTR
ncbi:methyltransferase [Lentzea sp. NPDC058450]|uniref:methyltransferase n=1 Tax=Lentzea sp. NPDC058450 TaxID=3346505 RepID=UPI0036596F4C